ncbi:MAG: hypothetical protein GDA50_04220 [Alphaproteobacteria bacterium GM202ARS2]|nr:hypothetical protein [Alphaproteobacteria bacterium GM202ARS2]
MTSVITLPDSKHPLVRGQGQIDPVWFQQLTEMLRRVNMPSAAGGSGWSPVLAIVTDGDRRVLQLRSWEGGTGDPPESGQYVGPSGYVDDIADAVDFGTDPPPAFGRIRVGEVTLSADAAQDVLELAAGSGVNVTPDPAGADKVTIGLAPPTPVNEIIAGVRTGAIVRAGLGDIHTFSPNVFHRPIVLQSFQPTAEFDIVRVEAFTDVGDDERQVTAFLVEVSNNATDGILLDVLAQSTSNVADSLNDNALFFEFSEAVRVRAGRNYAVLFQASSGTNLNIAGTSGTGEDFGNNLPVITHNLFVSQLSNVQAGLAYQRSGVGTGRLRCAIWARLLPQSPVGRINVRASVARSATTVSSSAFAFKGNAVTALKDFRILNVSALISPIVSGARYKAVIARLASNNTLDEVVSSNEITAVDAGNGTLSFDFSPAVDLVAGSRYAVLVGRVDASNQYALPVVLPSQTSEGQFIGLPVVTGDNAVQLAHSDPETGDAVDLSAEQGSRVQLFINASLVSVTQTDGEGVRDLLATASRYVLLEDAAVLAWNLTDGINFRATLGGNRQLANPSNIEEGRGGKLRITQDGTGGRTLNYGSAFVFANGNPPTLSTDPGAVDILEYDCISATEVLVRLVDQKIGSAA